MTTGSIYGNFANKAVLLVEVIEARIGEDLEQLPESLIVTGSPAEFVEYNLMPFDGRVQLRALLLEGAAASRADVDASCLRALQRGHLNQWAKGLDEWVARNNVTPSVDTLTAVTVVWSAELGQGLLEAFGLGTSPRPTLRVRSARCSELPDSTLQTRVYEVRYLDGRLPSSDLEKTTAVCVIGYTDCGSPSSRWTVSPSSSNRSRLTRFSPVRSGEQSHRAITASTISSMDSS